MNLSVLHVMVCGAVLAITYQADAQISRVYSRDALHANTSIEWFAFGADGAGLSTPVAEQFGTLHVQVASSSGELLISREGTTWHGDFTPGQYLLTQPNVSDSFLVSFSPAVSAVGSQIDPGDEQAGRPPFKGAFTARMCVYSTTGTLLGMVQTQGTANTGESGAAKFLGARSAGTPIGFVSLQVSGVTPGFTIEGDMGINRMDVVAPLGQQPALRMPDLSRTLPACGA